MPYSQSVRHFVSTIDTLFDIGQALGITFLSTTLHYTTSDTYEFEPMMANEPLEKPTP
jgi:hypothetical protein